MTVGGSIDACADCLRRTELIAWLAGHIEHEWRLRRGRPQLLALPDADLLAWGGDDAIRARYAGYSADYSVDRLMAAGLGAVCRCSAAYPPGLAELPDPPAVIHYAGDPGLLDGEGVAIVGARAASQYGLEVAGALGRGLAAAGVTVVSGMALGVDSAAHSGALNAARPLPSPVCGTAPALPPRVVAADGVGRTVAVLASGADRPYPVRFTALHREIAKLGCVVSEMPPNFAPHRWAFPARNRLIAALSRGTVVVEGGERSGSLITADFAAELGRFVGAIPGLATSPKAAGPHALIKAGAEIIRSTEDVLELLGTEGVFAPRPPGGNPTPVVIGSGERTLRALPDPAPPPPGLSPELTALLGRVERGEGSLAELVADPADAFATSRDLGELELRGLIRRVSGGRYIRAAS